MSLLARLYHAEHGDLTDYAMPPDAVGPDLEAARAAGFAAETTRIAERVAAIRADHHIAADPARLAAALALAPTTMSIADIKSRVAGVFDQQALAAQVAAKWAPRPQGEADPLAASDQPGTAGAGTGWSAAVAHANAALGSGAVKVEITPQAPQAATDVVFVS